MSVVWDAGNPGVPDGLPDDGADGDMGYVCGRCQRNQHGRCCEPLCGCCGMDAG